MEDRSLFVIALESISNEEPIESLRGKVSEVYGGGCLNTERGHAGKVAYHAIRKCLKKERRKL